MKYLIVGLGNIGSKYDNTRHNIGFDVVDYMAKGQNELFVPDTFGSIARIKHKGRTLILLKPSTYMNVSGKSVNYWMQKEKIKIDQLLVIVDDLNLEFGRVRLRGKGSDGGHNGIKHINDTIGQNYARIRVGIGDNYRKGQQIDFVLGNWSDEENKELPTIIKLVSDISKSYAAIGLAHTMSAYNN